MAARLVHAATHTGFGSSPRTSRRRVSLGAAQQRKYARFVGAHIKKMASMTISSAVDDDVPELPDYDIVKLGSLETSALALSLRGWTGGSDDANTYVAAVDRGYTLLGAHHPSELALAREYQKYWSLSDAAQLPGVRAPKVYAIIEVGQTNGASVAESMQAHAIAAGGAEPDVACLRLAPGADVSAVAAGVATAIELGACPGTIAVDGFSEDDLHTIVRQLEKDAPEARVAFNRIPFSIKNRAAETGGVLETCKALGVGVIASDPLGPTFCITDPKHADHDVGQIQLLTFLGAMVGGGVQRSPMQVGLNWVVTKGATPEVETRMPTRAWECGGAMLWRLDENAVGIVDERAAATDGDEGGRGGGFQA